MTPARIAFVQRSGILSRSLLKCSSSDVMPKSIRLALPLSFSRCLSHSQVFPIDSP